MLSKVALNTIKATNTLACHLLLGNSNVGISSVLDSSTHIVFYVSFVCLRLVYHVLPVSLGCPCLIVPSVIL